MMNRLISVIVPVFNTERYLRECLDSLLGQTYKNLEFILVDDGSSDNSWAICSEYQARDNRIRAFRKEHSGVSATRNFGLERASGEFVSFCDSDDVVEPNLYEVLITNLEKHGVDRVCGGYEYLYPGGRRVYCKPRRPDGVFKNSELLREMIDDGTMSGFLFSGVNNSIFKSSIIQAHKLRFKESLKFNEDSLFSFGYALHSESLFSLQSVPLYLYRQHPDSSTRRRPIGDKYSPLREQLESMGFDKAAIDFELQMQRRVVTETLWEILDIANKESGIKAVREIRHLLTRDDFRKCLAVITPESLGVYKKVYYVMMKHNMSLFLFLTSKRLVPFLSRYLVR